MWHLATEGSESKKKKEMNKIVLISVWHMTNDERGTRRKGRQNAMVKHSIVRMTIKLEYRSCIDNRSEENQPLDIFIVGRQWANCMEWWQRIPFLIKLKAIKHANCSVWPQFEMNGTKFYSNLPLHRMGKKNENRRRRWEAPVNGKPNGILSRKKAKENNKKWHTTRIRHDT